MVAKGCEGLRRVVKGSEGSRMLSAVKTLSLAREVMRLAPGVFREV